MGKRRLVHEHRINENNYEELMDIFHNSYKLKNDLINMEKCAIKAEKLVNMDSPEASVIELVTAMNSLSTKLSTSSKLIENKAEKEIKEK
ncbi:hypothetical protein [Lactococcus lactis]|uniref:Uncharacterized protein n=1 Tax=Lactococcus lactis subsp. lactis TaxID=1360 RepID=A0A2N5WAA5_LACLL|nr:hypothetical protein [Lactococcus lactis]PLW59170.1 hypothetical protein CYU10_000008 [Lactococcus lactis subsp. lactis]